MTELEPFGPHLTIDASGCNIEKLKDAGLVYDILLNLPTLMGMTPMTLPYVVKWKDKWADTPGVSGFVMIAESHISIHTFPEENYVFIDVFSCKGFDIDKAAEYLTKAFDAKKSEKNVVKRGLDFPRREMMVEQR